MSRTRQLESAIWMPKLARAGPCSRPIDSKRPLRQPAVFACARRGLAQQRPDPRLSNHRRQRSGRTQPCDAQNRCPTKNARMKLIRVSPLNVRTLVAQGFSPSGWPDSNRRPLDPQSSAGGSAWYRFVLFWCPCLGFRGTVLLVRPGSSRPVRGNLLSGCGQPRFVREVRTFLVSTAASR